MKKKQTGKYSGWLVCLLAAVLLLTACGGRETTYTPPDPESSSASAGFAVDSEDGSVQAEQPPAGQPAGSISTMAETTQLADPSEFHASGEPELLQIDPWIDGYASRDGYYRMVPREDGSLNLRYIDFTTKQEILLCSQPNCTHDSDACTSWFPTRMGLHIALPVADKVIVVHGGVMGYEDFLGEACLPQIEIMEPDGSERKKLFAFPASSLIAPEVIEGMARDDENLYFCIENHTEEGRTRALCAVSCRTGKTFKLADLPEVEEKIVGTEGSDLILSYIPYKYDLGVNFSELTVEVARFHLQTQETTPLFTYTCSDVGECQDGQCWLLCSDRFLRGYDLKTGALLKETKIDLPEQFDTELMVSDGLYDGKLMLYSHYASAMDDPSELFYYAIDIETGDAIRLEHQWPDSWGTNYPGRVAAQVGNDFMFIYTTQSKKTTYLLQDGSTMDDTYPVYQYAFQPAADYWNNSQNYTPVTEPLA